MKTKQSPAQMWREATKTAAAMVRTMDSDTLTLCPTLEIARTRLQNYAEAGISAELLLPRDDKPVRFGPDSARVRLATACTGEGR